MFPVVNVLTQDNRKLLEQLKSRFQITINWNKYQTNVSAERVNQYLGFLIDPSFQGVNRLFDTGYYLPKVEIKDYKLMIDGTNFFHQPVKNDIRTQNNKEQLFTLMMKLKTQF